MAQCSSFFESEKIKSHLNIYKQIRNTSGVWDNYNPFHETVLFTDFKSHPTCALILNGDNQFEYSLNVPLTATNHIYSFYLAGSTEHQVTTELDSIFKSKGITKASLYSLAPFPFPPSFQVYEQYIVGFNQILFLMTLHESFHFNVQYVGKVLPSLYKWPDWDQYQPDLDDLQTKCYINPAVKESTAQELKTLVRAYKLASIYHQPDLAREAIKTFLALRKSRYLSLHGISVKTIDNPEGISCEEAEARIELIEGSAEYFGLYNALKIGIIHPLQIADVSEFRWDFNTLHYSFGSLQLFLISELSNDPMSKITARIARSKSWNEGIGFEFSKLNYENQNTIDK